MASVAPLVFFSFAATQLLALAAGAAFISARLSVVENPAEIANSLYFFVYAIAAAVVILLVLKYYKGKTLFEVLELLLLFFTVQILSAVLVGDLPGIAVGLAAVGARLLYPAAKSALLLFASAVVGALLGSSLDLLPAAVLALLLAAYDVYAVFGSKHMITLAKGLSQRGAAFSVTMKQAKESLELGTGDLVIPGMLAVSALKIGAQAAAVALAGALAGVLVLFYLLSKRKGYWPALPPLVGGALLFLGLYFGARALGAPI